MPIINIVSYLYMRQMQVIYSTKRQYGEITLEDRERKERRKEEKCISFLGEGEIFSFMLIDLKEYLNNINIAKPVIITQAPDFNSLRKMCFMAYICAFSICFIVSVC